MPLVDGARYIFGPLQGRMTGDASTARRNAVKKCHCAATSEDGSRLTDHQRVRRMQRSPPQGYPAAAGRVVSNGMGMI